MRYLDFRVDIECADRTVRMLSYLYVCSACYPRQRIYCRAVEDFREHRKSRWPLRLGERVSHRLPPYIR